MCTSVRELEEKSKDSRESGEKTTQSKEGNKSGETRSEQGPSPASQGCGGNVRDEPSHPTTKARRPGTAYAGKFQYIHEKGTGVRSSNLNIQNQPEPKPISQFHTYSHTISYNELRRLPRRGEEMGGKLLVIRCSKHRDEGSSSRRVAAPHQNHHVFAKLAKINSQGVCVHRLDFMDGVEAISATSGTPEITPPGKSSLTNVDFRM